MRTFCVSPLFWVTTTVAALPLRAQQIQSLQVPQPIATRQLHASIAEPVPWAFLHGSGPMFQIPDGVWNHGEGFRLEGGDADFGGWFGEDDGRGLQLADIHTDPLDASNDVAQPWGTFYWDDPLRSQPHVAMRHFYGYLRPAGLALPTVHPRYGNVGSYVDTGAFELFCPQTPVGDRKIVIYLMAQETKGMPKQWLPNPALPEGGTFQSFDRRQTYRGYFSQDGLVRDENGPASVAGFLQNTRADSQANPVERPWLGVLAKTIESPASDHWVIAGYPVLSVAHRQTTLNEQRDLQVVEAVKQLLKDPSNRNPLHPTVLTDGEIDERVVVVFGGGSNGGLQGMWATLRYPEIVHGCYAEVINPSIQRLFSEHAAGDAFAYLTGEGGATQVSESDFLHWGQYAHSRDRWISDLSITRHFVRKQTYRPYCFLVGDEDITSTGTDWVSLISGGSWTPAGVKSVGPEGYGSPQHNRIAWGVAENACHQSNFELRNSYFGRITFNSEEIAVGLIADAVGQREAETLPRPSHLSKPPSEPRTAQQQLRGLDDPHEWALGRAGDAMPAATGGPLQRDDAWFDAAQPGAAGTWLGHKDAMVIRDGRVYVCGAEGVVTAFEVAPGGRRELVRVAHSHLPGSSDRHPLGLEGFAMTVLENGPSGDWELVVGTRRHLHRLRGSDLELLESQQLPWEVARPRHLTVGSVLSQADTGTTEQIVFASMHGGLCFYSPDLDPLYEWPEPGIADFALTGNIVTVLSHRGVVADVQFVSMSGGVHPQLLAASRSVPQIDYVGAPAVQGVPVELELMNANLSAATGNALNLPVTMAMWRGDTDGHAIRAYLPIVRDMIPFVGGLPGSTAMATCREGSNSIVLPGQEGVGDHMLVLGNDSLTLLDQYMQVRGTKFLNKTEQRFTGTMMTGWYTPGFGCLGLVVGELVDNPGGVYDEEVVVATRSGSLFWLHIDELLSNTALLPAGAPSQGNPPTGFWIEEAPNAGADAMPRSNRKLSAAWAISDRTTDADGARRLHVLDHQGAYWQLDGGGQRQLIARSAAGVGSRGWHQLGNDDELGAVPVTAGEFDAQVVSVAPPVASTGTTLTRLTHEMTTRPWCPLDAQGLQLELQGAGSVSTTPWLRAQQPVNELHGFLISRWGGTVLPWRTPTEFGTEAWYWSARSTGPWGNMVEGLRFRRDESEMPITGYWASTGWPEGEPPFEPAEQATLVPFTELRSQTVQVAVMTSQALRAERLSSGDAAVFVNCPGGRVRAVKPPQLRTDDTTLHALDEAIESTPDCGFGGSALATRIEADDTVTVWSGVLFAPSPRPAQYTLPNGALADDEVASSVVRRWTWSDGNGFTETASLSLSPSNGDPRGGYGVVGIAVADLLPAAGDEVIITTLAGDLFVYDEALSTQHWRTHVPGSLGAHNSIRVADLDEDGLVELYVGGSLGIWRFVLAD